jgi:glycosyltransferase involved in cell wall biosynthesis
MLEYAAVGVACVAAPTPDNVRLARLGVGMLAADPAHWRQWVALLASNDDARAYVAGRGREVAAGETYEAHADRWWDAWAKALDNRRATAREKAAA